MKFLLALALVLLFPLPLHAAGSADTNTKEVEVIVRSPNSIAYGGRPFVVSLEVHNNSSTQVAFQSTLVMQGFGYSGAIEKPEILLETLDKKFFSVDMALPRDFPAVRTTALAGKHLFAFTGTVRANSRVVLTVPTTTGTMLGIHRFLTGAVIISGQTDPVSFDKPITLVEGNGEPTLSIQPMYNLSPNWRVGQARRVAVTFTSPRLTRIEKINWSWDETCYWLPVPTVDAPSEQLTYWRTEVRVHMHRHAPLGTCLLLASVQTADFGEVLTPDLEIEVIR